MKLEIKPAASAQWFDFFVHSFPGGGKSSFILSSYWEKDDQRGGPLVFDYDEGGIGNAAVDQGLGGKIPIITIANEEELFYAGVHWKDLVQQVGTTPGFENYRVDVLAHDTVSSMEEMIMGFPSRGTTQGSGLMAKAAKRAETYSPHPSEYKAVMNRSKSLFRLLHAAEIHTIVTAHTVKAETPESKRGLKVEETEKEYAFYPGLMGDTRYVGMKMFPFYLYLLQRGGQFYAQTRPKQGGPQARTQFQSRMRPEVVNPKFWDFVAVGKGEKTL